jgi:Glucose-6-phosphate isomerase
LTLVLPPELNTLGRWLEQLIAESTGKEGKEVLPVIENLPLSEKDYSSDRIFVFYDLEEGKNIFAREKLERLLKIKLPLLYLTFSPEEIAEHFYIWELATALIGYFLKINPFNQPDVELTKKRPEKYCLNPRPTFPILLN